MRGTYPHYKQWGLLVIPYPFKTNDAYSYVVFTLKSKDQMNRLTFTFDTDSWTVKRQKFKKPFPTSRMQNSGNVRPARISRVKVCVSRIGLLIKWRRPRLAAAYCAKPRPSVQMKQLISRFSSFVVLINQRRAARQAGRSVCCFSSPQTPGCSPAAAFIHQPTSRKHSSTVQRRFDKRPPCSQSS